MATSEAISQEQEVLSDVVLEVRTGKMQKAKGLNFETGIDKTLCSGPVKVGLEGIEGDEHVSPIQALRPPKIR